MNFRTTDKVSKQEVEIIHSGLLEYNLSKIEDKNIRDIGIFLENDTGEITAGLIGNTNGNWLKIKYLWVDKASRGMGVGSRILQAAEEEAKARGCRFVFLDTFGFQAPDFYKKYGYKNVFTLEEYPVTGKRYYFVKEL